MLSITMLPARDGDCLFVEANGYRIVIDGGRTETGTERLPAFLKSLPARSGRPMVDLMVLTHVDADHISGLLALIADPGAVTIGEIWFNGAEHHKQATGVFIKPPRPDNAGPVPPSTGVLSIDQALRFDAHIKTVGIPWNTSFAGAAVVVPREGGLPRVTPVKGVSLVVLGPPQAKLANFFPEWERSVRGMAEEKVLAARSRQTPTVGNLAQLAAMEDVADKTKPNGASIAFVLETDGKRVLFTADAHPDDLADGLQRYGGRNPIGFDAIKVPHHGSAKNNTSRLINHIRSSSWLVSTDGSIHGHPDEEAIARIVMAGDAGKRLIFNYPSTRGLAWADLALQAQFHYSTVYGDGANPVSIQL